MLDALSAAYLLAWSFSILVGLNCKVYFVPLPLCLLTDRNILPFTIILAFDLDPFTIDVLLDFCYETL